MNAAIDAGLAVMLVQPSASAPSATGAVLLFDDVRLAEYMSDWNPANVVVHEPGEGWVVGTGSAGGGVSRTALYVGLGLAGAVVVIGGAAYLGSRKKKS